MNLRVKILSLKSWIWLSVLMNNLELFFLAPFVIVSSYCNCIYHATVVWAAQHKIVEAFKHAESTITWYGSGQLVQTNFNNSLLSKKWSGGNTINIQAINL